MEWTRSGDDLFIRLDPGDEIHSSLRSLAEELAIDAAAITSGIGRTRNNNIGYMDDDGKYRKSLLKNACELITLQGNLGRMEDGSPFTHIHATFLSDDMNVHAGHLFEATTHVVGEIHMRILPHAVMTRCPVESSSFVALKFE